MEFIGLALITENVPRLVAFYERVFGVTSEGNDTHATLALKGVNLAIYDKGASVSDMKFAYPEGSGCGYTTLMFSVGNAEAEYEKIKKLNLPLMTEPTDYPWGTRAFHFRDPDGNIVDFVERRKR